jgi:hypothetical protein
MAEEIDRFTRDREFRSRGGSITRGNMDAASFTGSGDLLVFGQVVGRERADTPANPPAGMFLIYMDSATGDILGKVTNTAGTTKSFSIADFSAL